MTYDCFTFFNELDLLEIRLNVLNDVVDCFVLVEATKTHSGKDKPLYFNENKERYKAFQHKIIHIIVEDYPPFQTTWTYENHQRNCIVRGLKNLAPDDDILISDLDEIPAPVFVQRYKKVPGIKLFYMGMYYYYLNFLCHTTSVWRCGTKMLSYKDFLLFDEHHTVDYNEYFLKDINQGVTTTKIRCFWGADIIVPNGGWHFSYLGKIDSIVEKLKSFAHQELNVGNNSDPDVVAKRILNGRDPFGGSARFFAVKLDDRFPEYILNNQEKYNHLLMDVTTQYRLLTWMPRQYLLLREKLFRFIVFDVIPSKFHPFLLSVKRSFSRKHWES